MSVLPMGVDPVRPRGKSMPMDSFDQVMSVDHNRHWPLWHEDNRHCDVAQPTIVQMGKRGTFTECCPVGRMVGVGRQDDEKKNRHIYWLKEIFMYKRRVQHRTASLVQKAS